MNDDFVGYSAFKIFAWQHQRMHTNHNHDDRYGWKKLAHSAIYIFSRIVRMCFAPFFVLFLFIPLLCSSPKRFQFHKNKCIRRPEIMIRYSGFYYGSKVTISHIHSSLWRQIKMPFFRWPLETGCWRHFNNHKFRRTDCLFFFRNELRILETTILAIKHKLRQFTKFNS